MTPRTAPASLAAEVLADIAIEVSEGTLWAPHAHVDATRRHHARLLVTDDYEAWLLGWAPGQHVGVHDHGDAAGALVVVEGELFEELPRARRSTRRLATGQASLVPPGQLHDVGNGSTSPALSIHVYSPPLSTMTFYDSAGHAPVRTEALGTGVVLSQADA
ncbi:MAG: cysteine dioxygenase [Acidimicrobiales bacterium]|nr:cysteine dioxygenase [Acidimicrobiales bacterium]